jgi:hypothetical protein
MLRQLKQYYIQSSPPKYGNFIHHSYYAALSIIAMRGNLEEGKKPWRGISLTTDPGRFLSPLPMLGLGSTVDGFVEFEAAPLIAANLVIPCLYRTGNIDLVDAARGKGHIVFAEEEIPEKYKYVLRFVCKNDMFIHENEWLFLGPFLGLENFKVYIAPKMHKRFVNKMKKCRFGSPPVLRLDEHPLLRKDSKDAHSGEQSPSSREPSPVPAGNRGNEP